MADNPTRPADLSAWLKDQFIPLWIERTCRPGAAGYVEEVRRLDGTPIIADSRSTMVTGRLLYSFSRAYGFDRSSASLDAARHGLAFLLDACRTSPGHFAHSVTSDGEVIDPHADLYDLAFVLLGLAGFARASGERCVLEFADEIACRLDGGLEDPVGGYREPCPSGERRRQFPQMHLFEAFQQLAALDPTGGWSRRAERIVDLAGRLVDANGSIDEWYTADWSRLKTGRREREIGHHFEWAWMLYSHADATGSKQAGELADRLFDFGIAAAGISPTGPEVPIPNAINVAGRPCTGSRPLWPTTELLRALVVAESTQRHPSKTAMADAVVDVIFRHSIDKSTGLWDNETNFISNLKRESLPTRVLYHIIPSVISYIDQLKY